MAKVDDLAQVNDDSSLPRGEEGQAGLTPDFSESTNKLYLTAARSSDSAGGTLPELTIFDSPINDGTGDGMGSRPQAETTDGRGSNSQPEAGEGKGADKVENAPAATGDQAKVATTIKLPSGGEITIPVALGKEEIIGRGKLGIPDDPKISRNHAALGLDEKGVYIKDLGSTNKTYVLRDGKVEELKPNEKCYLSEVSGVRFTSNGPTIEGGKPSQPKVEKSAPAANDTVVAQAPPDTRPIPTFGGREILHPTHLQRELTHGQIVGKPERIANNGSREEFRAKVMVDGKETEVILRTFNDRDALEQTRKEVAVYELNQALGLNAKNGAISIREFQIDGAKRFGSVRVAEEGKNLDSELRTMAEKKYGNASQESVKKLIEENPKLKAALEKAFAERAVFGESKFQLKDFVIEEHNGNYFVSSKSMESALGSATQAVAEINKGDAMSSTVQGLFAQKQVSEEVKGKVGAFLERFDNKAGHEQLQEFGLSRKEIDFMMARARDLVKTGNYPEAQTAGDTKSGSYALSESAIYKLSQTRRLIEAGQELRTKEQVSSHLERAFDLMKKRMRMTAEDQKEYQSLIDAYKNGDPHAMEAVHKQLALNVELPVQSKAVAPSADSVKDLQTDARAPENRGGFTHAHVLENGAIRNLLTEAGVKEERARELEKELTSRDPERHKKAAQEINKIYESRGGWKAFTTEAKGRLGGLAIVVGSLASEIANTQK